MMWVGGTVTKKIIGDAHGTSEQRFRAQAKQQTIPDYVCVSQKAL